MISLEITGLDKLIGVAEKYPSVSEKYINLAINRSLLRVWAAEKQEAPFGVSGILRDNWKVEMGRFTGRLYSLAKYALDVEQGTKPHFVPVDEIAPWAKKKGLNPWAVAKSIAKKGTKANPFFARAVTNATDGVNTEMQAAMKSITAELASGSI